jgi:nitrogen-specific signal transduction histidine kinase
MRPTAPSPTFANPLETVGRFFDDVAHEFRNPITAIKGFASILEEGLAGELSSSQRDYLRIVCARADDLNRLVDNMLDLSRVEAALIRATRRECTVGDVINRVQAALAKRAAAANIVLTVDADGQCPSLYGDLEQIARAVTNLAFNGQAAVRFSVSDNGPSISAERLRITIDGFRDGVGLWRIDRTFGLSLSIVRELVRLNLGTIDVATTAEHGNLFSFTVPSFDAPAILPRYLKQFADTPPERAIMLDMTITLAATTRIDIAEPLLQQHTGLDDLLLRVDERSWRLLVPVPDSSEAELRLQILREMLRDHKQEMGATAVLAGIIWKRPDERDDLARTFRANQMKPDRR